MPTQAEPSNPVHTHAIELRRPAAFWAQGTPIGNGDLGAMLWGSVEQLTWTVNKSDVWDYRNSGKPVVPDRTWAQIVEMIRRDDRAALGTVNWNKGRTYAYPSLQVCGELTIELARGELWSDFRQRLSLGTADASVSYTPVYCAKGGPHRMAGVAIETFACATHSAIAIRIPATRRILARDHTPEFRLRLSRQHNPTLPAPRYECVDGVMLIDMKMPDGFRYVMGVAGALSDTQAGPHGASATLVTSESATSDLFISVATSRESDDPASLVRQNLAAARQAGFESLQARHRQWWREYWNSCHVELPDKAVERAWYFDMYMLASAARSTASPIGLQGIWNNVNVPAWNSDYHNDTNTQLCYWSAYPTGHLDLCLPLYRMLSKDWLEATRAAARYFGCRGVKLPMAAGPDGNNIGGLWGCWMGAGAWLALHVLWHYHYSASAEFIREFYPWLKEVALFYEDYLQTGDDGKQHVFPDMSPEQIDSKLGSFGQDPTCTLSLVRHLMLELADVGQRLNVDPDKQATWRDIAARVADYPQQDGHWIDLRDKKYAFTHRHTSRLFPVHPTGEISLSSSPQKLELAIRSYREFVSYDTETFGGFSGCLLAAITARLGLADEAWGHLRATVARYDPNTLLHVDDGGDDRAALFQVEANLGLPYGACECLLQSHEGFLRLFPAMPASGSASFHGLLTYGAFRVSATLEAGRCTALTVLSTAGGLLRLLNPFGGVVIVQEAGREPRELGGEMLELSTHPGQVLSFSRRP